VRRRRGCLGCLGGVIATLGSGLLLGAILYMGILAVFAPWAYYLGGTFHLIPEWQGWGRARTKTGDFVLFVRMVPWTGRQTWARLTGPSVRGMATICTPNGKLYSLRLSGDFTNKSVGIDTDDQPMHLWLYYRPFWFQFNSERRPAFELYGTWHNPDFVSDDRGTLARAFLPDGSAYLGPKEHQPGRGDPVSVTLAPGKRADFDGACQEK
jgi:hypothetical protein